MGTTTTTTTRTAPAYDVTVDLSDVHGNVYAVNGRVTQALLRDVGRAAASDWARAAMACRTFDAVRALAERTVHVH